MLCRNQNNAIGCTCTIDGAGGSVLQYVDTFDVGRVQSIDIATGHTIDNVDRSRITIRTGTTDIYLISITRLTGNSSNVHTGRLALQSAQGIRGIQFGHIIALYFHRCTGHQFLLLDTVTYYDYFFQHFRILGQGYFVMVLRTDNDFFGGIADERNHQRSSRFYFDREITVDVGNNTLRRTFNQHIGTNDRSHGIANDTRHFLGLLHGLYCIYGRCGEKLRCVSQREY